MVDFQAIYVVDFEFSAPDGERPTPICMVARELRSGRLMRLWQHELARLDVAPFDVGAGTLFVAYYASAELGCFLAQGWPLPANVLDLCAEFKRKTSGLTVPGGRGLLAAMMYHGLDTLAGAEKESMRQLAMRGGPFTAQEQAELLDYCQSDVDGLAKLYGVMRPKISMPHALLRGRYMKAAARMEHHGTPIDVKTLQRLKDNWLGLQGQLIAATDVDFGIYDGRTFKQDRFESWLIRNQMAWPRLASGALDLSRDTFREMARVNPQVAPLAELRHALSDLRLNDLAVGRDGRNRCLLGAFASRTGRNQPSNSRFIFGPSTWLRSLIQPPEGRAVAYLDWAQQEFGIAAALSGDQAMLDAYRSGDPYLAFARQAGAVPPEATKKSHAAVREQFKAAALAVQYGMGPESLAQRINQPVAQARHLLDLHQRIYARYWRWSDAAVDHAMLRGHLHTVFDWRVHAGPDFNPRSLRNFPMQANGAEMLRLACCLATERGIEVCAPVHDAILIEGPAASMDEVVTAAQATMAEASHVVLGGFTLGTDAKVVNWPARYADPRGERMWNTVMKLLPPEGGVSPAIGDPYRR